MCIRDIGEAVVVTQELDDIVSSPIIKDTIINNADCKILLDQRKYINKFDSVPVSYTHLAHRNRPD